TRRCVVSVCLGPGGSVGDPHALEVAVAGAGDHLAAGPHPYVRQFGDLLDEVVRHRPLEAVTPHHDRDAPCHPGEEHGGLARRVGAADDVDVVATERLGL